MGSGSDVPTEPVCYRNRTNALRRRSSLKRRSRKKKMKRKKRRRKRYVLWKH